MRRTLWIPVLLAACGDVKDPMNADEMPVDALTLMSGSHSFEFITAGNPRLPYNFTTGIKLTQPVPNPTDSNGLVVIDCTNATTVMGFNCASNRALIPDGVKFLAMANVGASGRFIEFTFPADIVELSIAVSTATGAAHTYAFTAFDAAGANVASAMVQTGPLSGWAANRASLAVQSGFRQARITNVGAIGDVIVLDHLRWTAR